MTNRRMRRVLLVAGGFALGAWLGHREERKQAALHGRIVSIERRLRAYDNRIHECQVSAVDLGQRLDGQERRHEALVNGGVARLNRRVTDLEEAVTAPPKPA